MRPDSNVLLMMSGSIACAKATSLISGWRKQGHRVRVACTGSVAEFIGHATLEGLSGEPVFGDTFEAGRAMDHITLAQWADLVVVCPASANLLARFANGIADDAVTTLWQATWGRRAPQFVVPAMNTHMWNYPATRENVERLRRWGVHVLPTSEGDLACGERGAGRMLEVDEIQRRIESVLAFDGRQTGRRILLTGGGTREPIDAVRYIGNHSTGRTAAVLADALVALGHEVTWLGGAGAREPGPGVRRERFVTFADLDAQLERLLGGEHYDGVIHAAAVSDFSVARGGGSDAGNGKIPSGQAMDLRLEPNPKLLSRLRGYSRNPDIRVVGFKLTVGADEKAARAAVTRLFDNRSSDLVVHNDFEHISDTHHGYDLHGVNGLAGSAGDSRELARALSDFLEIST